MAVRYDPSTSPIVRIVARGPFACFTRPELSVERVSYDVMTPSAALGILECLHWKPQMRWRVRAISVLKPIRHVSMSVNEVNRITPGSAIIDEEPGALVDVGAYRMQRHSLILADVAYGIEAGIEAWDGRAWVSSGPRWIKHRAIVEKRLRRGQTWRSPCLGQRQFRAVIEPVDAIPAAHPTLAGARAIPIAIKSHTGDRIMWVARMVDGRIEVPPHVAAHITSGSASEGLTNAA